MATRGHLLYFAIFCAGSTPKSANKNKEEKPLPSFQTSSFSTGHEVFIIDHEYVERYPFFWMEQRVARGVKKKMRNRLEDLWSLPFSSYFVLLPEHSYLI